MTLIRHSYIKSLLIVSLIIIIIYSLVERIHSDSSFNPLRKISNAFSNHHKHHQQSTVQHRNSENVFVETEKSKLLYPDFLRRAKSLDHNQARKLKDDRLSRSTSRMRNKLKKLPKDINHVNVDNHESNAQFNDNKDKSKIRSRSKSKSRKDKKSKNTNNETNNKLLMPLSVSTDQINEISNDNKAFMPFSEANKPPQLNIPPISPISNILKFNKDDHSKAYNHRSNQRNDPKFRVSPTDILGLNIPPSSNNHSNNFTPSTLNSSDDPPTPIRSSRPSTLHLIADDNLFFEALKDYRKRSIVFGTADNDVVASLGGKSNETFTLPSPTSSSFEIVNPTEDEIMADPAWKSEVKRLFIIREIASTERSYAKHLTQLLDVSYVPSKYLLRLIKIYLDDT